MQLCIIIYNAGINNTIANSLSCFQVPHIRQLTLNAAPLLDIIPAWLAQFLELGFLSHYQSLGAPTSTCWTYQAGLTAFQQLCYLPMYFAMLWWYLI